MPGGGDVQAARLGSRLPPTAKGLASWQGVLRPTPSGRPENPAPHPAQLPPEQGREIYLHITEKETFFFFPCADRNLRKHLSVTDAVDACDSWLCDGLRPFRVFVFQTQLPFVLLSQYFRKAITKIRSFRNPGRNSCICIQFQQ